MKNILAKSNGILLSDHSKKVSETSEKLMKRIISNSSDFYLFEVARIGGLLHDIAKSTLSFQKMLNKKTLEDDQKNKFRHNEIGWAFLYEYLDVEYLDLILDQVYWHHGISNKMNSNTSEDILNSLITKDVDIQRMKDVVINLLGQQYLLEIPRSDNDIYGKKTPEYYYNDEEHIRNSFAEKFILCRTCLISADRLVSKMEESLNMNDIDKTIEKFINKSSFFNIPNCPSTYNKNRFDRQIEISNDCDKTTIVKGPGGFGKTCVGLLWSLLSDKKCLWVCPRNFVADSAYNSLKNEIDEFGLDIKIELFLTGDIQKANYDISEPFTSDIIITNIDSYLSPTVGTKFADKLFLINSANVVFDEYHELVTEAALFSCFVNIMKVRHNYTDSRTLLLSATPIKMEFLWETTKNKTKILPNQTDHYPAAHNHKTNVNVIECLPSNIIKDSNSLILMNSISKSQEYKDLYYCDDLIHSGFIDKDKNLKIHNLYQKYDKKSLRHIKKSNIMGTRVIQASFDVSFQNVFESVLSPESTLQAYPRGDRWGDYIKPATYTTFKVLDSDLAENKVRDILYDRKLSDLWFNYLKKFNGTKMTLNELYCEYNLFSTKYATAIKIFITSKFQDSLEKLSFIYPKHFKKTKSSKIKTSGGNKLRTIGSEIFVIAKYHDNPNKYTDPISTRIYKNFDKDFDETNRTRVQLIGAIKSIIKSGDPRFDYTEIIKDKNITLDKIRDFSNKSNTPYIRFDKVYHPDYGLITRDALKRITTI